MASKHSKSNSLCILNFSKLRSTDILNEFTQEFKTQVTECKTETINENVDIKIDLDTLKENVKPTKTPELIICDWCEICDAFNHKTENCFLHCETIKKFIIDYLNKNNRCYERFHTLLY